ncbi:MAG: transcriptional regulator [Bdellovibrionales bacterium RIFOXYD12_FULL_39_22]|nr:MAG: transcriptional regulator [Bdellovibrionales bacterium RIFOXYB1_FULL_39_21]OFZ42622.1 MAG: transcriptional regulator [Bdellovibrionales bacterium RIFOXYC12_FULL_39_17]OFZ47110.1 MAG: transcriptional regulator [Bdellovibrionales bacterium RIFOXYC1_FULL_39_130]OFZ75358.1 MAG: transcriptional regulator [Bdellovibrionales bacterium RIFOXYD1_FULL_39_84]OFZ93309.1 MAG: transcriptional regulator [Bdellovibrionales bacterium RIFOXYD12_FULL_39_22]HLE10015.1 hydrogen peroxide-inducible genes act
MTTITQLEYVVAVDKFRHFGKAAAACFVTQPTLSMQLQKLEEDLGVIVFDRSKNPILPTMEGEAVIKQAKIVISEHKKIKDVINLSKKTLEGEFKLAVIPTLAPYVIPLFAKSFSNKFPNINLTIEETKTEDIIKQIERDELDAGLLVTPLHNNALIERVLYYEPFYLFVDPKHELSKKNKVEQTDLSLSEIWLLNKGNCFRDQVLNICAEKNPDKKQKENLHFESGNFETLKNMVLKYSGYTLLPHMAVSELSTSKSKLVREFIRPVPTREVSIVHGRSFLKERVIDAIEKEILDALPKELRSLKNKDVEIVEIY